MEEITKLVGVDPHVYFNIKGYVLWARSKGTTVKGDMQTEFVISSSLSISEKFLFSKLVMWTPDGLPLDGALFEPPYMFEALRCRVAAKLVTMKGLPEPSQLGLNVLLSHRKQSSFKRIEVQHGYEQSVLGFIYDSHRLRCVEQPW